MGKISLRRIPEMQLLRFQGRCFSAISAFFLAVMLAAPCSAELIDLGEGDAPGIELEESYLDGQRVVQKRKKDTASTPTLCQPEQVLPPQTQVCLPINFHSEHAARNGTGGPLTT